MSLAYIYNIPHFSTPFYLVLRQALSTGDIANVALLNESTNTEEFSSLNKLMAKLEEILKGPNTSLTEAQQESSICAKQKCCIS